MLMFVLTKFSYMNIRVCVVSLFISFLVFFVFVFCFSGEFRFQLFLILCGPLFDFL